MVYLLDVKFFLFFVVLNKCKIFLKIKLKNFRRVRKFILRKRLKVLFRFFSGVIVDSLVLKWCLSDEMMWIKFNGCGSKVFFFLFNIIYKNFDGIWMFFSKKVLGYKDIKDFLLM